MPPAALVQPGSIDTSRVLYDLEAIRDRNPHRFEAEQLTAIVHVDYDAALIIGYKEVREDEFWVHGHMPGYPLMPGTLICEAAAQLCSFYGVLSNLVPDGFIGLGGLENIRFRGEVKPGDRLLLVGKGERLQRRQMIFVTQGFVGDRMVYHGKIIGVPIVSR
jgi:3-hydroxyacyl-[acyl-carrier-protein] dehydratase